MATEFFLNIIPPTITQQQHKVAVRNGKPQFFEPPELKAARAKLEAHLSKHVPDAPYEGGVRLTTRWCFPRPANKQDGEYRTSRPDTDNLQKMLKDVMTKLGYWIDDALVASENIEKFWADRPGIYVRIEEL